MVGEMKKQTTWAQENDEAHILANYYSGAGTSTAAAVVSGVAALILDDNPALTNNQVKYAIIDSARPAVDAEEG